MNNPRSARKPASSLVIALAAALEEIAQRRDAERQARRAKLRVVEPRKAEAA